MFNCDDFLVHQPYPSVEITECNTYYATLISGAFAGPGSETTAITQYTAHNFFTFVQPQITEAYQCIISVELLHLNLLGNLIRDLGLPPKFLTYETHQYWNGSYPVYAYELRPILLADIEGEHAAIAHYTRLIQQIAQPQIQDLFRRIILDEQKHVEILEYFLGNR
ncbi:ferritin family protein [Sporobacter termitidis]|nr:ferritin family protein [Sporobacter termitidis]